jgi:hypothetical protein
MPGSSGDDVSALHLLCIYGGRRKVEARTAPLIAILCTNEDAVTDDDEALWGHDAR